MKKYVLSFILILFTCFNSVMADCNVIEKSKDFLLNVNEFEKQKVFPKGTYQLQVAIMEAMLGPKLNCDLLERYTNDFYNVRLTEVLESTAQLLLKSEINQVSSEFSGDYRINSKFSSVEFHGCGEATLHYFISGNQFSNWAGQKAFGSEMLRFSLKAITLAPRNLKYITEINPINGNYFYYVRNVFGETIPIIELMKKQWPVMAFLLKDVGAKKQEYFTSKVFGISFYPNAELNEDFWNKLNYVAQVCRP